MGGDPAESYCEDPGCNVSLLGDAANFHEFPVAGGTSYLNLAPFSVTAVTINDSSFYLQPFLYSSTSVQVQLGTTLGNTFVETLFPPVPEIGLNFLTGYPILDGSQSYQPHSGSSPNAAIVQWVWTVITPLLSDPDRGTYYGQQAQLAHPFVTTPADDVHHLPQRDEHSRADGLGVRSLHHPLGRAGPCRSAETSFAGSQYIWV